MAYEVSRTYFPVSHESDSCCLTVVPFPVHAGVIDLISLEHLDWSGDRKGSDMKTRALSVNDSEFGEAVTRRKALVS